MKKVSEEHHVTKSWRSAESASSNIVLYSRFIWLNESMTLIRAETERYDIVGFSKVTTRSLAWGSGSLIGVKWNWWEQTCRWTLSRAGVKTRLMWSPPIAWLYIRELAWDECKRKVESCLFDNRLSFSEFSMIFRICWTWGNYAWLWIVLSVPRKRVIVWFPSLRVASVSVLFGSKELQGDKWSD